MFSPKAPPSVMSNFRAPRPVRVTPESVLLLETTTRDQLKTEEVSARVHIEVTALNELTQRLPLQDAESLDREAIRRSEDRARLMLLKEERGSHAQTEARTEARVQSATQHVLSLYYEASNTLLEEYCRDTETLYHEFEKKVPLRIRESTRRKGTPPKKAPAFSPRPPSTFPSDRHNGRVGWEKQKALNEHFRVLKALLEGVVKDEPANRGEIEGSECQQRMGLQTNEVILRRKVVSSDLRNSERHEAQQRIREELTLAKRSDAALRLQCWHRRNASRAEVRRRKASVAEALVRAAFADAMCAIARVSKGYEARLNLSKQRPALTPATVTAPVAEETSRDVVVSSREEPSTSAADHPLVLVLSSNPDPDQIPRGLLLLIDAATEAAEWTFKSLDEIFSQAENFPGINILRQATCLSIPVPPVEAAVPEPPLPFSCMELLARSIQPPVVTRHCTEPFLALLQASRECTDRRLVYCERILQLHGIDTAFNLHPTSQCFSSHLSGLNLLVDAAGGSIATSLPSIAYLQHGQKCAEEGLFQGRIDPALSPSRWRPYTGLDELFEEERAVVMKQEDSDRYDLEVHQRNMYHEIGELWRAMASLF